MALPTSEVDAPPREIGGERRAAIHHPLDGALDGPRGIGVAEMVDHHGAGPDHGHRVGAGAAGDVRRGPMHRLEHGGEFALRIEVGGGREPHAAGHRGAEVGEDVAEEIAAHHHVEPVGMGHEVGAEDVDVVALGRDVRVVGGDGREALVPIGHGVDDTVGLGGRREPASPPARELEGIPHHPVDALAGEDALLHHRLLLGAGVDAPAHLRVFALVVLADDDEVDVGGAAVRERRGNPLEQLDRPQVDILPEGPAQRDQEAPERDMVRHAGKAHRAQQDRVERAQHLDAVLRHHPAGLAVGLAAPVEMLPVEADVVAPAGGLQHPHGLGHDLLADAVAGDDRDPIVRHGLGLRSPAVDPGRRRHASRNAPARRERARGRAATRHLTRAPARW